MQSRYDEIISSWRYIDVVMIGLHQILGQLDVVKIGLDYIWGYSDVIRIRLENMNLGSEPGGSWLQIQFDLIFQVKAKKKNFNKKSKKSKGFVWKNLPQGGPEGNQTFPEGCSPEGKSDYPRDLPWANFVDNP